MWPRGPQGPGAGFIAGAAAFLQGSSSTSKTRVGEADLAAQGYPGQGHSCSSKEHCSEKPILEMAVHARPILTRGHQGSKS